MLTMTPLGALALIGLALSLLLAIKLWLQSPSDPISNRLLAIVCLTLAAWDWSAFFSDAKLYIYWPHLLFTTPPLLFLFGPALLAYVKRITLGTEPLDNSRVRLHLLPSVIAVLVLIPAYRMPVEDKLRIFESAFANSRFMLIYPVLYIHMLAYVFLCFGHIKHFRERAESVYSDLARVNLRWLTRLCVGMFVLLVLDMVLSLLPPDIALLNPGVVRMGVFIYIVFLAFSALGQPAFLYKEIELPESDTEVQPEPQPEPEPGPGLQADIEKYSRSGLRRDTAEYYLSKLRALMCDQQRYLDSELTLRSLASELAMSPHHLSQALNDVLGKSFYDYINEQRIDHAKGLLLADTGMPIIDVAFACGYNNKVSFYNAFKRYVGVTPTEYRQRPSKSRSG